MVSHMSYIHIWVNQQSAFLVSEQIDDISLMFFSSIALCFALLMYLTLLSKI